MEMYFCLNPSAASALTRERFTPTSCHCFFPKGTFPSTALGAAEGPVTCFSHPGACPCSGAQDALRAMTVVSSSLALSSYPTHDTVITSLDFLMSSSCCNPTSFLSSVSPRQFERKWILPFMISEIKHMDSYCTPHRLLNSSFMKKMQASLTNEDILKLLWLLIGYRRMLLLI